MSGPTQPGGMPPGQPGGPAPGSMQPGQPGQPAGMSPSQPGMQPPPPMPPGAPAPAPPAPPPGPDIAAAMSGVVSKLSRGEQFAGAGALIILVLSFLVFGILLDTYAAGSLEVALAVGLVLAIWLKSSGRYDLGIDYRTAIIVLGGALLVVEVVFLLNFLRSAVRPGGLGGYSATYFLGALIEWAGGILAGIGAWMVWRGR